MTTTHVLETPEADISYDLHGPLPTADGRPPLFMVGQPMDASGFGALAAHFPDRTVVTYDPRGLGRSVRKDGRVDMHGEVTEDINVALLNVPPDSEDARMVAAAFASLPERWQMGMAAPAAVSS